MPEDEQEPPVETERQVGATRKAWFRPNRSGPGWHPSSWQGWLLLGGTVAAIVAVVVLFRTGML
jgi:hypothetical protein